MGAGEIPSAIARGKAAESPDAVKPLRIGIGAGLLAGLFLFVAYLAQPVPARIIRLFGGPTDELGRKGGLEMVWLPPPGMDAAALEQRFAGREQGATLRKSKDGYIVTVPGVSRDDVETVASRIGAGGGGLAFQEVVITPKMADLARVLDLPMKGQSPIDLEVDQWRPDEGGDVHTDYYLLADSQRLIEDALASAKAKGWQLPAGTHIALETFEGHENHKPYWRTYVLADRVALGGESIANAAGSYDPNTNRPIVLLDFDRAGAEIFGEVTARIVGQKLAIVVDGMVKSAPIINGRIAGGRASITMGGSDPRTQEHERDLLVAVLRGAALPGGGTLVSSRWVPPGDTASKVWPARVVIAVGAGLLVGLLAWALVRALRPTRRRASVPAAGPLPWSRLFVTLLAPVAIVALSHVPLLGVDYDELAGSDGTGGLLGMFNMSSDLRSTLNIGVLGVTPIVSAYVLVELLALAIPGWRRRRHAGPVARRPVDHAVAMLAFVLVLFQGWMVVRYLESLLRDVGNYEAAGLSRPLVVASLAAGTLVYAIVAHVIRRWGLANGYGALLAGSWLVGMVWPWLTAGPLVSLPHLFGAALILFVAVTVVAVLRWRVGSVGEASLRVPVPGIVPASDAGGLALLFVLLASLPVPPEASGRFIDVTRYLHEHASLVVVIMLSLTALWSWAFARPSGLSRLATRAGLAAPAPRTFWRAVGLSAAVLLFLLGPSLVPGAQSGNPLLIALVVAFGLDVFDDLRARRGELVVAWSLQHAQHADLVGDDFASADIPCHLTSTNLRTLLAFFGPFAPIDVLVPAAHAAAARDRIAALVA